MNLFLKVVVDKCRELNLTLVPSPRERDAYV